MKLGELYTYLCVNVAPQELSCPWDNDGVMCADGLDVNVKRVLVALEPKLEAIEYAAQNGFDLLLTHHPLIFRGIKHLDGKTASSRRAISALRCDVPVISLHTRLDAAEGGVNDALVQMLGLESVGKFGDEESPGLGRLVSFEEEGGIEAEELAGLVKERLGCSSVRVYGNAMIEKAAVVGGDGKDFIIPAESVGAGALITGDAGYNDAEEAAERGFVVIEAGHYHTEFPVCLTLANIIEELGLEAEVFESCPYINI